MKKSVKFDPLADRPSLDFSKGERGRYAARYAEGTNIVLIDADLQEVFPDSTSVNRALRAFLAIDQQVKAAIAPSKSKKRSTVAA